MGFQTEKNKMNLALKQFKKAAEIWVINERPKIDKAIERLKNIKL